MKRQLPAIFVLLTLLCAIAEARADQPPATTPLTRAIRIEDFAAAKQAITRDSVNKPDLGGYHPLTYAAYTRNPQLVKALLDGGADPNKVEHDGSTAMSVAACLNQPEIIRILHQAGADYPTGDKVTPPVANAVRADALDSLKVLLELYPALNINAGWPWPEDKWEEFKNSTDANLINPHFASSAVAFACVAGYDEMLRFLLTHGADSSKKTYYGINALHYAAENNRISSNSIAALIKAGLNPSAPSYASNGEFFTSFQPSTPLDLACSAGSLEKVKILSAALNARNQAGILRRAALIAAAHGHSEVASSVYQTLGEKPPAMQRYIRHHPDPRTKSTEPDVSIPMGDISASMPVARPAMKETGQAPGTIAVIASPALRNHASMLSQKLTGIDGLTVLERDEIDRVAEEKLLGQFGQSPDLKLIPAAQLVVLEDLKISGNLFIKVTLVSTNTRVVEMRMAMDFSDASEAWVDTMLGALFDKVRRVNERGVGVVALSLVPLTSESPSRECLELARYANLLLPTKASQQPDAVLLNLQQMRHLEAENAISNEGSYWKAAWVIEGSLTLDSTGSVRLGLFASPTGSGQRIEVTTQSAPGQLADSLDKAWQELTTKLSLANRSNGTQPGKTTAAAGEADMLARQARWFVDAAYPHDAFDLASAAFLLGNRSEELLRTMTKAAIDRLPMRQNRCSDNVTKDPRILDPAIRFRMADAIPEYLTLCDCARLYVAGLNKQLDSGLRSTKASSGKSGSYNEVVSHALVELQFFRQMMEDSVIASECMDDLRILDQEIASLTTEFLAKCKDHTSEASTMTPLVFDSRMYYAKHQPELLKHMLDRLVALVQQNDERTIALVAMAFLKWSEAQPFECRQGTPYAAAINALASSPALRRRYPDVLELLSACPESRTSDRVSAMRRMVELGARPDTAIWYFDFRNRDWERFLGSRRSNSTIQLFVHARQLHGGIGSLILNPPKNGFEKTGEFARLSDWYLSILRWSRMEVSALEKRMIIDAGRVAQYPEKQQPTTEDILACRALLGAINRLTPETAKVINRIAPVDEKPKQNTHDQNQLLTLEPLLTLPESPSMIQSACWTQAAIDGDQLWLPVIYTDRSDYLWSTAYGQYNRRKAIHVIGLTDRSVRTVALPDDVPEDGLTSFFEPSQRYGLAKDPAILRKIILGDRHAYFLSTAKLGIIYAINRQTLNFKRVELPLSNVIGMAACARGDTLYLSIAEEWSNNHGPKGANAVVAVEGTEITKTIVSNQRKPPQTPLDDPSVRIDLIDINAKNLVLISCRDNEYTDPGSFLGASCDWEGGTWQKFQKQDLLQARMRAYDNFASLLSNHRQVIFGGKSFYFTEDGFTGGVPAALILVKEPKSQLNFRTDWLKSPNKSGQIQLIPVAASPLDGETQMDRLMYFTGPIVTGAPVSDSNARSANQTIRSSLYDATVCCKWKDRFLIFLTYRTIAMPAIWTASESEIQRLAQALESR